MLSRPIPALVAIVLLAGAMVSCRQGAVSKPPSPAAVKTNRQTYQVQGIIKELMAEKSKVKIAHEAIPDYMEAMTMDFEVKHAQELAGLQPGDAVSFRLIVTEDDGWIEQLKKLDSPRTPLPSAPAPESFRQVRAVDPLVLGDKMPDYSFTNVQGRVVRLSDFPGQALALTFVFTRCPFPTFCPRLSGNFAQAQQKLSDLPHGPTNWHLLSITLDPEFDTAERLKAYGERFHADPQRWDFLTGDLIDITAIGEQFGLQFWRANPNEPINHNVRTVVVDAAGRIQWINRENEWTADTLVAQIIKAANAKPGS